MLRGAVGNLIPELQKVQRRDNPASKSGSSFGSGWYGYVDKDLRTQAGLPVKGKFSRPYCGNGNLVVCRQALWLTLKNAADSLAAEQGPNPDAWRSSATAERIAFIPGLIPTTTMRWTNRPTFQQVVQFAHPRK